MSDGYRDQDHPEKRPGEMHMGNVDESTYTCNTLTRDHVVIPYQTARRGQQAYDCFGAPMSGAFPLFISRDEYRSVGGVIEPSIDDTMRDFAPEAVLESARRMVENAEFKDVMAHLLEKKYFADVAAALAASKQYVAIVRAATQIGLLREGALAFSTWVDLAKKIDAELSKTNRLSSDSSVLGGLMSRR